MTPAQGINEAILVLALLYGAGLLATGISAAIHGSDDHRAEWARFERAFYSWLLAAMDVVAWLIGRRREPAQNEETSRPSQRTSKARASS
jgi:hypothetical protein